MKQRRSWDSQGNPIVEVQSSEGSAFRRREHEDNTAIRRLNAAELSIAETRRVKAPAIKPAPSLANDSGNPYASSGEAPAPEKQLRRRSSLDYLRALSEEIKMKRELGKS